MKLEFFRHGAIYGAVAALTGISNIVLVSVYTRGVDQSAYGVLEFVSVLEILIFVIAGVELSQGIARFYGGADTDDERRAYASTGFWSLVIAYAVVCGALFLAADRIEGTLFAGAVQPGILRPALVSIYLSMLFYVVRSQLRWELRAFDYAFVSLIAVVVIVAVSAYLLLVIGTGLVGAFVASSLGYAIGIAWCLLRLRGTYKWSFDVGRLRTMLAFSLPLTLSSLALVGATYGDRLLIRSALGFSDLGVYAVSAKVAGVIGLAGAGLQLGAAPLIYRHYGKPETPQTLAQLLRLFISVGVVGVIALACVSLELLTVIATPEYVSAWRVVPLLALATLLATGYIFLPGLTLANMTSRFAAINIAAAAAALVLIAVLVQTSGLMGAAIGTLGGAGVGFGLHAVASQRVYALPVRWWRIVVALGIGVATFPISWSLGQSGTLFLLGRLLVLLIAGAAACLVVLQPEDRGVVARIVSMPFGWNRARTAR